MMKIVKIQRVSHLSKGIYSKSINFPKKKEIDFDKIYGYTTPIFELLPD